MWGGVRARPLASSFIQTYSLPQTQPNSTPNTRFTFSLFFPVYQRIVLFFTDKERRDARSLDFLDKVMAITT